MTTKGQYTEKDAAAAVRTMLEVGEAPNMHVIKVGCDGSCSCLASDCYTNRVWHATGRFTQCYVVACSHRHCCHHGSGLAA